MSNHTDPVTDYLRGALQRIADLGGAQGVVARAALLEADALARRFPSRPRYYAEHDGTTCDYGAGSHRHGPFTSEKAAAERIATLPDPDKWFVVAIPAGAC